MGRRADPYLWTARINFCTEIALQPAPTVVTYTKTLVCLYSDRNFRLLLHLLRTQAGFREQLWITVEERGREERRICSHPDF